MDRTKKEITCLNRLQDLTGQLPDIIAFLKAEGLVDDNQIKTVRESADYAKEVHMILRDLQVRGKFQLLEYTWNVLPVENICIFILTDRDQKEFIYSG